MVGDLGSINVSHGNIKPGLLLYPGSVRVMVAQFQVLQEYMLWNQVTIAVFLQKDCGKQIRIKCKSIIIIDQVPPTFTLCPHNCGLASY